MSSLAVTTKENGNKIFVVTQGASMFENIAMQFDKIMSTNPNDFTPEKSNKIRQQEEAIRAAKAEVKYREKLIEQHYRFEVQRANDEFDEFYEEYQKSLQ